MAENLEDLVNTTPTGANYNDYGTENEFYRSFDTWEPKKQHQFIMDIDGIPAYLIKTSAKPTISNGEITLDHINVQRYVKGKSVWNAISIQLYDPIVPSAAAAVMDWVRLHHESVTGRDGYSSMYKKQIKLMQLSPLGEIVETWTLKGAFITESNFGSLDWSAEDVVMIDLTLRYDWALFGI
jgi:hypothetical protein